MAGGEHEPISIRPRWVLRVEPHLAAEDVGHGSQGHGCAGVTGVRGLDRVDGQGPDRGDAQLLERHVTVSPGPLLLLRFFAVQLRSRSHDLPVESALAEGDCLGRVDAPTIP